MHTFHRLSVQLMKHTTTFIEGWPETVAQTPFDFKNFTHAQL